MQRKDNIIIWVFFSIVFIGTYFILKQQSENIANSSYLISAFISLSLTFILDRVLQKRAAKSEAENSKENSLEKKALNKTKKLNKNKGLTSQTEKVPLKKGKNQSSKKKK